jgi:hypothetical protein
MNLIVLVQGFKAAKQEQLCEELAKKYGVPVDEVAEVVGSFLKDTYGPAERLAEVIQSKERPVLLFIGRKDCIICQRSQTYPEKFLLEHKDLEGVLLDYSLPEGLIYPHNPAAGGKDAALDCHDLPGLNRMIFTGKCVRDAICEKNYNDLRTECSQNIYAVLRIQMSCEGDCDLNRA